MDHGLGTYVIEPIFSLIFHNIESWPLTSDSSTSGAVADRIAAAFAAFAKTLPARRIDPGQRSIEADHVFDGQSGLKNDSDLNLLALLQGYGTLRESSFDLDH